MENEQLFAGIDVSTQSCKLIIIDINSKKTVFLSSVNYDKDLPKYNTLGGVRKTTEATEIGVSESDPNMWIEAIHLVFDRMKNSAVNVSNIRCISVSGQQHGLVTITKDGDLSRPYSKLWNDFSTGEECEILTEKIGGAGEMIKKIGNTQRTGYTAPKIFHMVRHEPANYEKTWKVFLVHNYINWWLTGGKEGGICAMEPGDVSGSALWDPQTRDWNDEVIKVIAPDLKGKLPDVLPSRDAIGKISKELVEKFGFSEDCLIASGSGDNMMGAIGTGNYREGIVTVSLGTSGTAYTFMKKPYVDPDGEIAAFCDATGNYLPLLCISNLANGYEATLNHYNITHKDFEEIIMKTKPGNKGRLLLPWYIGERTPDLPDAAPIYFGFELHDFTQEILCRAVLEGHVLNLYEGFKKLPVSPKEIRLTGGISRSKVWRETIANIFDCEVIPVSGEGAAMGAALHAAWTFNKDKTIEEIADDFILLEENERVKPNAEIKEIYNLLKEEYIALSMRIRGVQGKDPFKLRKQILSR